MIMVANQTETKKRKSNRNWAIQAIERLMVANDNGGEPDRNKKNENLTETRQYRGLRDSWWRIRQKKKERRSNRNWAIQVSLLVANQTEKKENENLTETGQ